MIVCGFRLALIQLKVGSDKTANICRAIEQISKAKHNGASVVSLPECFNSPYGTKHFPKYAESVPNGETCKALSKSSQENEIYVVGGTIPERDIDGKLYNTCTVWGPTGDLITTYRKVHLFDISIPGKVTFRESDVLSPGNSYATFSVDNCKIGIGICYDIRFGEMARIYRNEGCQMLIYPGAFNMNTGPLHWELLHRARAVDCQLYVAGCSPSRHKDAGYIAWGHSLIVSPWGHVLQDANEDENIIYEDIDLKQVEEFRSQIPIYGQRRTDIYNTVNNILVKNP